MENLSGCREVLGFSFLLFLALRMAIELMFDYCDTGMISKQINNDAFIALVVYWFVL